LTGQLELFEEIVPRHSVKSKTQFTIGIGQINNKLVLAKKAIKKKYWVRKKKFRTFSFGGVC